MDLEEKQLSSKRILSAKVINVREDEVLSPKGICKREVVEHTGGVVILPFIDENNIILIRQWRYCVGQAILELPAGKLEQNEDPFECAKRELTEETGFEAQEWQNMGFVYSTPGFCNEKLHLYIAKNLVKRTTNFDEFELIENEITPVNNIKEMVLNNKIVDAKTLCLLYKADLLKE